jgi:hypothetical protein
LGRRNRRFQTCVACQPQRPQLGGHTVLSAAGAVLAQIWRTLKKDLCDPYRPELHYMRRPGPKWREKHAVAAYLGTGLILAFLVHTHYPGTLGLREWIRVVLSWPLIFFLRSK